MFSGHGLKLGSGDEGLGQKLVDLVVWVAVDDPGEHVGEVAERLDVVQLAHLDQRSDDGPVLGAAVRAREGRSFGRARSGVSIARRYWSRARLRPSSRKRESLSQRDSV